MLLVPFWSCDSDEKIGSNLSASMWLMTDSEALAFIAIVALMATLAVLAGAP